MPARRLAMRATFSPCSASGIAQPRITSSISAGSSPGARFIASRITTAAISSGLVKRSDPFGDLPTGVRTAETMTASFISVLPVSSAAEIREKVFEGFADFLRLPFEQVIGAVDDHQFLWFFE